MTVRKPPAPTGKLKTLFDKLDTHAALMLTKLQQQSDDDPDDAGMILGISERARVFKEVSAYAFARARMEPGAAAKTEGKFGELKRQFHSQSDPVEGGTPVRKKPGPKAKLKSVG